MPRGGQIIHALRPSVAWNGRVHAIECPAPVHGAVYLFEALDAGRADGRFSSSLHAVFVVCIEYYTLLSSKCCNPLIISITFIDCCDKGKTKPISKCISNRRTATHKQATSLELQHSSRFSALKWPDYEMRDQSNTYRKPVTYTVFQGARNLKHTAQYHMWISATYLQESAFFSYFILMFAWKLYLHTLHTVPPSPPNILFSPNSRSYAI